MNPIIQALAAELQVRQQQVQAAADLLDGGATVPFIARYRKEATGDLDDVQLRRLEERLVYLRELHERRGVVLSSIEQQGKLTPALRTAIESATTKQDLEDLYAPFKPKRRTKGQIAREAGLEPLADRLWADPALDPAAEAAGFVNGEAGFADAGAVLDGVRDLLAERWSEDAALVGALRERLWTIGLLQSSQRPGLDAADHAKTSEAAKFRDYADYAEPIRQVPSHRALAVFRGRALECLDVKLGLPDLPPEQGVEAQIARRLGWSHQGRAADELIRKAIAWTWRVKLALSLERDLFQRLREAAESVAIDVFGHNLRDLLLAAPAGPRVVMGLDPGIRTGVKVAVVDGTGKVVATGTVYPHEPRRDVEGALHTLAQLVRVHRVDLIAIGNGTASRETDRLAGELLRRIGGGGEARVDKVVVSESGASVYSASELASQELPDLDVSLRGAVSIARRLQDPLAELVKIDPKSIGVGQYQHDLNQNQLARRLDAVVEDCVNAVGVDLNTASAALLSRVSGLSGSVAAQIVRRRDEKGPFANRQQLLDVNGLGPRTFEQAAGFLRIRDGDNPLDRSGVHPETYPVVQRILAATAQPIEALLGRAERLRAIKPEAFADAHFGALTVRDILAELEKPGRDPRPDFRIARFDDSVGSIADLAPGMVLEGTVSNVAQFGAFVDLGVHEDGLVHVSRMARRFVRDAREIVRAGQVVKVRVLEVDIARKRIGLTMNPDDEVPAVGAGAAAAGRGERGAGYERGQPRSQDRAQDRSRGDPQPTGALAAAFAKAANTRR